MEKQSLNKEKILPFQWSGWDEQDVLALTFYTVTFTEDFGVFEKGEEFDSIFVDYGKGYVEAYKKEEEEPVKKQNFKATAI